MLFKRVVWVFALAFGFLGFAACIVGAYAVWSLGSRLERANDKVFDLIDKGLASAQERVGSVAERVEDSKITSTEIGQNLQDWGTSRAKEGLASRLEAKERAEKLAGHLQTADLWLETSAESIRSVQQIVELANTIGASLDPAALKEVLESVTSLQNTLQQTQQTVAKIRDFTADKEGESDQNRLSRVTKLLGRILVTFGEIDVRLRESVTRLSELQIRARQVNASTSRYILVATMACFVLLAWIAAGQVALWHWGWTNWRPSRS
ncbi:MAG: hypothetical protein ACJ8FY_16160 [Gemmataceae bacterium]